jgi:hypothetical protein
MMRVGESSVDSKGTANFGFAEAKCHFAPQAISANNSGTRDEALLTSRALYLQ